MKLSFITFAFCLIAASASACPNLSGHYVLKGEDGVVRYTVDQQGCDRVEIRRISTYLGETSAAETQVFIVDGKPHGKAGTINNWVGNKLQIGPTANHVYYGIDSSRNLHISDGRAYPQCNGPCDEVAERTAKAFRWIHPNSDPQLWEQVLKSFGDELSPDESGQGKDQLDVYRYKYIQRVGVLEHSALVIIGRRPAKAVSKETAWNEYYSALNLDLTTGQKSSIERADQMWNWKFHGLAKFGPSSVPDVTFTYLTCTECESELVFASLEYDATKSAWRVRSWGDGKDLWWTGVDGVIVDMDVNNGGDILSFDCAYGIVDVNGGGFQNFVVRCKQITDSDKGRAKIEDSTVLYSLVNGKFKRQRIQDDSEALALMAKICRDNASHWLCKLPGYMTATSGQNDVLDQMFPQAPRTSRNIKCFRNLSLSTTMSELVQRCGIPDELGGSGINIFIYHLDDGSIVALGAAGTTTPLMYANYTTTTGKSSDLIARK